jgi:hypothetical protein
VKDALFWFMTPSSLVDAQLFGETAAPVVRFLRMLSLFAFNQGSLDFQREEGPCLIDDASYK